MKSEIILVDKPSGMSSFGVVARVRRVLTEQENQRRLKESERTGQPYQRVKRVKVGHTGTLDPFATGLLILLTGENTKRAGEFLKLDKEYIATLRLGAISTTGDPEGEKLLLVASSASADALLTHRTMSTTRFATPASLNKPTTKSLSTTEVDLTDERFRDKIPERIIRKIPNKKAVENCVEKFVGENFQKVPEFSAVKINGQRAYKLAREGKKPEMPVRKVTIYELEVLEYEWPKLVVRAKVSSGTYIRALAEDIGEALGVGAYLTDLRRTEVGEWRIEEALPLEKWMENRG